MKGPQNTLFHRVSKAGLLDSTMERFRAGETLAAVAAWLTEQGIQTDIAQTHRFKKGHYDDWTFEKAGIDIKSEDTNDINLDTIKRLSVILNQESRGLSGGAEISRFVQTFARFHEILMSRKSDMRAEHDARRKMAMRILRTHLGRCLRQSSMKPDTYFRHSGRPPCTPNVTDASGSEELHESSGEHFGGTLRTTAGSCESLTDSGTTSQCADGSPRRRGRPRKSPSA